MKRFLKWSAGIVAALLIGVVAGCVALTGGEALPVDVAAQEQSLAFVRESSAPARGRILAVITSTATFGPKNKNAGYELTELARAYYVFVANGYEVDFASPKGGEPPVRIDDDDLTAIDHAFMNDARIQARIAASKPLRDIDSSQYQAVYFVGGKGAMFDFPDNPDAQRLVRELLMRDGTQPAVVGAVCHGPAALLNVQDAQGRYLIAGKRMAGFTNAEELFLIEKAREIFPYLLQDKAVERGALFQEAPRYLNNVVVDGRLVTGQNPWSTWSVAEQMVQALGHTPVSRPVSAEERAVALLLRFEQDGFEAARAQRDRDGAYDANLMRMHAVIALMEWELGRAWNLLRLAG